MGCFSTKQAAAAEATNAAPNASTGSQGKLLEKYTLGKVLGQGAFGIVYSCKKKGTKEEYAVKMIDKVETPLAEIKQEVETLQKLAHPSVVKLHDVFYEKAFVCMVMDIHRGGDMIEGMQLHWKSLGALPISVVANMGKQMIRSIAWLHQNSCVHRDVKGDNYLMDRRDIENPQCRIYLSDFGTVRELKDGERLSSKCGTKTYWAPEFFAMNYGLKVDVWAIGVVMYGLVTGRFPFKGEEDVKNKKVVIPVRGSKQCGELLRKVLERKEADRLSASEAANHPFVGEGSTPGKDSNTPEAMDFKPEVKESGANAGVAERRRELIGRLEDANQAPGAKAPALTLAELKSRTSFEVTDRQAEKTTKFEWWSRDKAMEKGLIDFNGAKRAVEDDTKNNAESSARDIKQMLEDHNIRTNVFGTGKAKKFEEFVYEVQSGSSRLMLDATKHKSVVRVVDVVLLRIVCKTSEGMKYLVQVKEQFPDGRERANTNQLPGTKKEPHENAMQTALRIVQDRLSLKDCQIKFDFSSCECFEEEEDSPSYPGVRTVYRKEIYEGKISTTDSAVLKRVGLTGDGWTNTDSKQYKRTFSWLDEKQCNERKVKLKALQENADVSALVHAPVGIGEEDLKHFLESNNVDVSKFGEGTNKSLKEFSDELVKGEAALSRQPDGKVIRVVDVVILKITRKTDVLVEIEEEVKGNKKSLNWLPAVKRRPDENMFLAAHRAMAKALKVNDNFISLKSTDVMIVEEEKQSAAYCGLPTLYRKRIISAEVLKGDIAFTV